MRLAMTSSSRAVTALAQRRADGTLEVQCPAVGVWRDAPAIGTLVRPGMALGALSVLGSLEIILAPPEAQGIVVAHGSDETRASRPCAYGDVLVVVDPSALLGRHEVDPNEAAPAGGVGLVFRTPSSGRFYARPAPDRPPFVAAGDEVASGQVVAILEVMKSFHRIAYGGGDVPPKAVVRRVVPRDGDDVEAGDALLELDLPG
jgi:acetyl-CoA carboxylase biotin carboxyl carrier protein